LESHTLIGCGFFTFTLKGKETRRRRGEGEKGRRGEGEGGRDKIKVTFHDNSEAEKSEEE